MRSQPHDDAMMPIFSVKQLSMNLSKKCLATFLITFATFFSRTKCAFFQTNNLADVLHHPVYDCCNSFHLHVCLLSFQWMLALSVHSHITQNVKGFCLMLFYCCHVRDTYWKIPFADDRAPSFSLCSIGLFLLRNIHETLGLIWRIMTCKRETYLRNVITLL